MRHVRVWPVLGLLAGFAAWPFTARPGGQVWPVLTAFRACLRQRRWSVGNSQPPHVFIDGNSINARYSGNFPVRLAGAVQGFDRLYAGHRQLIGHAKLSRHFRAELAQHNQPLQWPVLTRTCAAGLDRAVTRWEPTPRTVWSWRTVTVKAIEPSRICQGTCRPYTATSAWLAIRG